MVWGIELHLKPVQAVGTYGWNNVCETIIGERLDDISQNQVFDMIFSAWDGFLFVFLQCLFFSAWDNFLFVFLPCLLICS